MATATTPQWGNTNCPQLQLTVNVSSQTATQVTLSWSLDYVAHGYAAQTSVSKAYTAVIDGSTVASGNFNINGISSTRNITSGTKTVTKSAGSQTITFSCSMGFNLSWGGVYGGTKSASGSLTVEGQTTYRVTYNANGGSGAPSAQTKTHGVSLKLSTVTPYRSGYVFQGWATTSTGGVSYNPGDYYTTNASITLYAVWGTTGYTVSYNANGGSGAPSAQTKQHGVRLRLSYTEPIRTNYIFLGWGTSAASTTVSYEPGDYYTRNADITLFAVWQYSYNAPEIMNVKSDRCDNTGNLDEEGTYGLVTFDWSTHSSVDDITIQYRPQSSSTSWTTVNVSASGTYGSVRRVIGGSFDIETAYEVRITVTDSNGDGYYDTTVPAMSYIIDFLKGGTGVAIGGPSSRDGFEVVLDTTFRGSVGIGTDAPTDNTVKVNRETRFDQAVEMWSGLKILEGNLGLSTDGQVGFATESSFNAFLERETSNSRPKFIQHVIMNNGIYLQGLDTSNSITNLLGLNSSNELELNWPPGGLRGRVFKRLFSGALRPGYSATISYGELAYYRMYGIKVYALASTNAEIVNALLIGARANPSTTTLSSQRIHFFSFYASGGAVGMHVASCTFNSNNSIRYDFGENTNLLTGTTNSLGNITEIWGII